MIALLILIVSTGCRTARISDLTAREILISEIPDLPEIPNWPDVQWFYESGSYFLTESDVDKVLNYLENAIPLYRFEIAQYEQQLHIVVEGLLSI